MLISEYLSLREISIPTTLRQLQEMKKETLSQNFNATCPYRVCVSPIYACEL